jgi:5-formyltetrahydrofolate cyclo-ligase
VTTESLAQTKSDLRRWITAQIRGVTGEQRAKWSQQVLKNLIRHDSWCPRGGVVSIFGGIKLEVDVMPIFSWLQDRGCEVALFAMEGDTMRPWRVRQRADLRTGVMSVLEPVPVAGNELAISDLDVVLTPGLAFDRNSGMRMGRGKGHYDRIFGNPQFRGVKIGVGFGLQVMNGVPAEAHDRPLDHLVTEQGWLSFGDRVPINPEVPS